MKIISACVSVMFLAIGIQAQSPETPVLVQGSLISPGSEPFHLKTTITEGHDPSPVAEVEMFWVAPNHWRRTIQSQDFSQTLIVNGDKIFDQHSNNYFPLGLITITTAITDPQSILATYQSGGRQLTKANGASSESGSICYDAQHKMCLQSRFGLMESVEVVGHSIDFTNYQNFHGKRIARRIVYIVSVGNFQTADITSLDSLKHPDENLFAIPQPTQKSDQITTTTLKESELRSLAIEHPDIIWPQVLDGAQTGNASFYIGVDPQGRVREVLPVKTANERSNDSAIRTIYKWKFKPAIQDGHPVQAEGLLTFTLNTRAYGPADTLDDAQMRKLATNMVEPVVQPGSVAVGTEYKLWVAVDADGIVIEKIAAGGPPELFGPIDHALQQWHFSPIMENNQPRPYRGLLIFKF